MAKPRKMTTARVQKILRNKYFIVTAIFVVWITFFDENNLVDHFKERKQLSDLKEQVEIYKKRIAADKQRLMELQMGKKELEKFAREQYFMSEPDEDVFIFVPEE